jgi:hypothetical protein
LPVKYAKVDNVLKLKGDDGWVVTWTGTTDIMPEEIKKVIRGHRHNTGDSLPKIKDEEE